MIFGPCLFLGLMVGPFLMPIPTGSIDSGDLVGSWGGEHIRLTVTEQGGELEYDCAFGTIAEPLRPDKDGNFDVRGFHTFETGGPVGPEDPKPKGRPARFQGWTDDKDMRLTVYLTDTGYVIGTFSLGLGRKAILEKCG
jgi:hypothetical protein